MPTKFKPDMWIERFRNVHGDRYEYGAFEKVNKNMMVTITCPDHGDFKKQLSNHWSAKAGCPVCSKANLAPQSNHLSRDQWIARFKEAHGDRCGYDKFEPAGYRGIAIFICSEHGDFEQHQQDHARGRFGCEPCRRSDSGEKFFSDARARFGDRYSYEKFEYFNAKTKSVISCREHGDFTQNPDKHLSSRFPCPECNTVAKRTNSLTDRSIQDGGKYPLAYSRVPNRLYSGRARVSEDEYLQRLSASLPSQYTVDMSKYVGLTEGKVILTCPLHGESEYGPQTLLLTKHKCKSCARDAASKSRTKDYGAFVTEATLIHDGDYSYPDCPEYINRRSTVTIVCATHGEFKKKAQKHLSGQGCPQCTMDELRASGRLTGGYSMDIFDADEELGQKPGTVYYLKVGNVYKIGITALDVQRRIASIRSQSKQEVVLLQTYECSLRDAYVLEQSILKRFEEYRTQRRWSTELFTKDVLAGIYIADVSPVPVEEMDDWGYHGKSSL